MRYRTAYRGGHNYRVAPEAAIRYRLLPDRKALLLSGLAATTFHRAGTKFTAIDWAGYELDSIGRAIVMPRAGFALRNALQAAEWGVSFCLA